VGRKASAFLGRGYMALRVLISWFHSRKALLVQKNYGRIAQK